MDNFPTFQDIKAHQKLQKAKIYNSFKEADEEKNTATIISKADFEAKYPTSEYEIYRLSKLHEFRQELQKGEDYSDEKFAEMTKDLKHFVVQHEGKQVIAFARKKVAGE